MLKHILFGGAGGGSRVADIGLMVCRVCTGLFLALGHGCYKLPPEGVTKFAGALEKMSVPAPTVAAWAAMFAEFFCGILLAIGLFTRPTAALIAITMLTAIGTAHRHDPLFMQASANGHAKEFALLYMIPAILFLCTGAGRYGLDALIRPRVSDSGGFPLERG
jgi:putative oxidoreductase